ncbi:MAG: HAD family hydrolase [Clostridia bacterium]|nr:HAD family hydrolase [Clostridia bacterium]
MNKIKAILFDLDGTLLPMDMDKFTSDYMKRLCAYLAPRGYAPSLVAEAMWHGIAAMVRNDGAKTNEEAFWEVFAKRFGKKALSEKEALVDFYRVEFPKVQPSCGYTPEAKKAVDAIKAAGYRVILATNPLFPAIATEHRIRWAGFEPSEFEFFTAYEDSRHCKPNLDYYRDVLARAGLNGEDCLMVGNDAEEDMIAAKLGMKVFLLTDCLLNKKELDISKYPQGSFDELTKYINER